MQARPTAADDPCLLAALPEGSPAHAWLTEVAQALRSAERDGARVQLLACEADAGPSPPYLVAATALGRRSEVRRGDSVCAGFALRADPQGGLSVMPRVYRVECTNGSIRFAGHLQAVDVRPGEVRQAVEDALSQRVLDAELAALQQAAERRVPDALRLLALARVRLEHRRALEEFRLAGDPSAWGLVNAVTATARGERDWRRRLDAEQDAGGILARLPTLPRMPSRALDLQVPCERGDLAVRA